jgi:site-specific DNA-adenine methylase
MGGGKRWQLSELELRWKPHQEKRLVEPFCGGLGVFTGLMPATALLNDINPHVVNVPFGSCAKIIYRYDFSDHRAAFQN